MVFKFSGRWGTRLPYPRGSENGTHRMGSGLGLRNGLEAIKKKKKKDSISFLCRESEYDSSDAKLVPYFPHRPHYPKFSFKHTRAIPKLTSDSLVTRNALS